MWASCALRLVIDRGSCALFCVVLLLCYCVWGGAAVVGCGVWGVRLCVSGGGCCGCAAVGVWIVHYVPADVIVNQLYFPTAADYPLASVLSRLNGTLEPARALITEVGLVVPVPPE